MKVKKVIALIALLIIILTMINLFKGKTELNSNKILNIRIQELPSPPKFKTIDKKEDIKAIADFINSLSKEEIEDDKGNGWVFFLEVNEFRNTYQLSFLGDRLYLDKKCYRIDEKTLDEFRELYNSLSYEEKPYTEW